MRRPTTYDPPQSTRNVSLRRRLPVVHVLSVRSGFLRDLRRRLVPSGLRRCPADVLVALWTGSPRPASPHRVVGFSFFHQLSAFHFHVILFFPPISVFRVLLFLLQGLCSMSSSTSFSSRRSMSFCSSFKVCVPCRLVLAPDLDVSCSFVPPST